MTSARDVLALGIASLLAILVASAAGAQPVDIPAIVTLDTPEKSWGIAAYTHQVETDLDGRPGSFSRNGVMANLGHRFDVGDDSYFAVQGSYVGSYYDFSKAAGSTAKRGPYRWEDIHTVTFMGLYGFEASEKWTWVFGGLVKSSGESGANFDDTLTGGGIVGFNFKSSDTLKIGLMLGVMSQIEDSAGLLPIPTVNWRFADGWKLDFGILGTLGHPGIGPDLSYRPSEHWEFGVGVAYQKRRFRLDDHANFSSPLNPSRNVNPNNDGVGQETSAPIYVRARWAASKTAFLDIYAGVTAGGKLRIEKEHGGKIKSGDYKTAPILGLRGQILF